MGDSADSLGETLKRSATLRKLDRLGIVSQEVRAQCENLRIRAHPKLGKRMKREFVTNMRISIVLGLREGAQPQERRGTFSDESVLAE